MNTETNQYIEIQLPTKPFDATYKDVIDYIKQKQIINKEQIENIFNVYTERYFKIILSSSTYYRFDYPTNSFMIDDRQNIKDYIDDAFITINVKTKIKVKETIGDDDEGTETEKEKILQFKIKPLTTFKSYIKNNGWLLDRDINKPQLYKIEQNIRGNKIITKYINDSPRIPQYLIDNYKHFEEYEDKYKKFVNNFWELIRYSLCSENEKDFEYMKNWTINKALLKRNQTTIILQSTAQGIGKTAFSKVLQGLFDNSNKLVEVSSNYTWLQSQFNGNLKNKVLMCCEELPKDTRNSWINSFNRLKDFITNDNISIECKGKDAITCPNDIDFVITTNNIGGVPLEENNRRYFIPTVISIKDDKIDKLTRYIYKIITSSNKKEYFRCLYAYCKDNYNESFDPFVIPITSAIQNNNDKQMNLLYKFIKVEFLLNKRYIKYKEDEKKYIFNIPLKTLCKELKEFLDYIDGNTEKQKEINYYQIAVNSFKNSLQNNKGVIQSKFIKNLLLSLFENKENKDIYFGFYTSGINKNCAYFEISYDDLLEQYKYKKYVDDVEYEQLHKQYYKKQDEDEDNEENEENTNEDEIVIKRSEITIRDNKIKQLEEEIERLKKLLEDKEKRTKGALSLDNQAKPKEEIKEIKEEPKKKRLMIINNNDDNDDLKVDEIKPKQKQTKYKKQTKEEQEKNLKQTQKSFDNKKNIKTSKDKINIFDDIE